LQNEDKNQWLRIYELSFAVVLKIFRKYSFYLNQDQEGPRISLLWVTREYQVTKRPTRQRKKRWTRTSQQLKDTLQITWRNGWPKSEEDFKKRDQICKNGSNEMKERKPGVYRKEDTKWMPSKEKVVISRLRTGYARATPGGPKMEGVGNPLWPSATPIYPSTTYCGNAKKLRTREQTWIWIKNNGSTGKKVWKRWLTTQKKSDCTTEYRNGKTRRESINQGSDGNEERKRCPWNINLGKKNVIEMKCKYYFW
jgi:hypothetical protein